MRLKNIVVTLILGCFFVVGRAVFAEEIPVSGTLYPNLLTKISARVAGRVQEIFVSEGDRVEKGQILAKIEPVHFEIDVKKGEIALEMAKLAFEDAKTHFSSMEKLWNK